MERNGFNVTLVVIFTNISPLYNVFVVPLRKRSGVKDQSCPPFWMWADFASVYVVLAQQLDIYCRHCVGSGGIFVFDEKKNERKKKGQHFATDCGSQLCYCRVYTVIV